MLDNNVFDNRILPSEHDKVDKTVLRMEGDRDEIRRYLELF